MSTPMQELPEFVKNDTTWPPSTNPFTDCSIKLKNNPNMGDDSNGFQPLDNVPITIGIVVPLIVLVIVLAILIYCYCRRKQKLMYKQGIQKHAQFRHTVNGASVFTVQSETQLESIQSTSVTSERCLRYSGEPGISSLPVSGRSVSYDCLGDGDKSSSWTNLRNSVSSDHGYYGSDTLGINVSASHLSKSAGIAQSYLDSRDSSPERSLSSDHIQRGQWPPFAKLNGNMGNSLGRDSGLGSSMETCLSYQTDSKSSLSNYSMLSSDEDIYSPAAPVRPKSLPPLYPSLQTEIKKVVNIPFRSMLPAKSSLDENENQPDVQKHIQYLRERFYDMRHPRGHRDATDTNSKTFGTTNFTIGIFGTQGGNLQLFDKSASLAIPEGALPSDQELYLYAFYENASIDGKSYLRRVIECGPDGLGFKKPVCLSFKPRLIPCDEPGSPADVEFKVVYKNTEPENWKSLSKTESFFHAEEDFVTVHVNHFTRFTVVPAGASASSSSNNSHTSSGVSTVSSAASRKFYLSVYVGTAAGATTHYKVCFIDKDKEKLKSHNSAMAGEGFRSAVATPKLFNFTPHGGDVFIDIPSLHGCEFKGANKRHVLSVEEFETETVEDLGLPQRDFLLALKQHNTEGLFEVSAYQQKIHDKVLTFCISMNINNVKETLMADSGSADLTHRDVMEFLAGVRLAQYHPHFFFPKDMKLDICTNVESSPSQAWMKLAEFAQIPGNKYRWIETYVKGKHVTPCYVVLDFIEAKLIAKDISIDAACDQLASMLERVGHEVAADYCNQWKAELTKRTRAKSPQKEKGNRGPHSRFDFGSISPNREDLGTILEESNISRDQNPTKQKTGRENYKQTANVAIASQTTRQTLGKSAPDKVLSPRLYSKNYERSDSALSLHSPDSSTPSPLPDTSPFTISSTGESKYNVNRPNIKLRKANREKSGRNDSGIGSEIQSPNDIDQERVSHI